MPAPLTYSWIALAGSAPVILLLTSWTLAIFHCRKRQWSTIDIFLVSILSQSIIQQFLTFTYALLSLLKLSPISTGDTACAGLLWFFITIPIFKGATVASLAVDRCLHSNKFGYRLSVHKNHIRYHVGVLAVLSCVVGFTALLTFNSPELLRDESWSTTTAYSFDKCTFLPYKFDSKFVIFYIIIHVIIVITGLVAVWKASSCSSGDKKNNATGRAAGGRKTHPHTQLTQKGRLKRKHRCPPLDLTPTLSNTSTASSNISVDNTLNLFSTPGLRAKAVLSNLPSEPYQLSNEILLDFNDQIKKESNFRRLSTSGGLFLLTCVFTHLPLIVATLFSRYALTHAEDIPFDLKWPITNVLLWCHVTEGLITLLILLTVDSIVPTWIFKRNKKCTKVKGGGLQHYQPNLTNMTDVNMTLTTSEAAKLPNKSSNNNLPHGLALSRQYMLNNRNNNCNGNGIMINSSGLATTGQPQQMDFKMNKFPITNGSLFASLTAAAAANAKGNSHKPLSRGIFQLDDDGTDTTLSEHPSNIYVSLTNDFDSFASFDKAFTGDEEDETGQSYHMRCASVTTVANDDFEFHTTTTGLPMPYPAPPAPVAVPTTSSASAANPPFSQATYVMPKSQHQQKSSVAPLPPLPPAKPMSQLNSHHSHFLHQTNQNQNRPTMAIQQIASTSVGIMATHNSGSNNIAASRFRNSNNIPNQFNVNLEPNFSIRSKVSHQGVAGGSTRNTQRERPMIHVHGSLLPPGGPAHCQSPQQLTSLSMNDLDLIEELPDIPISTADLKGRPPTSTEDYKHPPRLYRKRPRFPHQQNNGGGGIGMVGAARRRIHQDAANAILYNMPNRRVLSLECLSPTNNKQTDSPFFDVSYLDTGDVCLVKQGDGSGSRCIFVTDFL